MLHDTLKTIRKQKGYSQEEVAGRLNVVRQTVSKWEKGLSVPDADMLVKLSELYDISVADLLSTPPHTDAPTSDDAPPVCDREIAEQLSRINEQLVTRNRRARRIWQVIVGMLIASVVLTVVYILLFMAYRVDLSSGGTVASEHEVATMQSSEIIIGD